MSAAAQSCGPIPAWTDGSELRQYRSDSWRREGDMAKPKANAPKFPTVTMVDSRTLTRADGTTSLRLDTKEFGSIAFRIDLKAIEILRRELATAEAFLRQPTGKA